MSQLKAIALAGALVTAASASHAADMPIAPEPVVPIVPVVGGWYLRGDIGFTNQSVDNLDNALYAGTTGLRHAQKDFDASPFGGLGVGYRVNQWLRFDVTGEYRSKADFTGLDTFEFSDGVDTYSATDSYTGSKSEWTGLLNAYVDLGSWYGISPFIGAGIGFSRNTISGFQDYGQNVNQTTGVTAVSLAYGGDNSTWNFAWALQAGLGYEVTPGFTVDIAYRYLYLGDAETGDLVAYDGTNTTYNPMKFEDLSSQDFKIGLRWALGGPAGYVTK